MLKAGFYEKEITPPLGDYIPGYAGPRDSTSIHDPLFSRAVAIRTGEAVHECVIMITCDVINIPDKLYDFVMEKVEKWTLVPQKNIMIAATHSHTSGPVYESDGEFVVCDEAWLEMLCQSTADAAIMAYQRMQDASAKYACMVVEGLTFCRDYYMKDGSIRTNPGFDNPNIVKRVGEADSEFPVIFFFDNEENPIGAVTSFACHHDCKAGTELSADYSGVLADKMKDEFGRNFVNILFQGFCGNLNGGDYLSPKPVNREPGYLRIGKKLAEAEKELFAKAETVEIDAVYAEKRVLPVRRREVSEEVLNQHKWALENVPNDWYQMDIAKPENWMFKRTHAKTVIWLAESDAYHAAYLQVIRLGNDISIYAAPGEQYVEYQLFIKDNSPTKYNLFSGTALKGVRAYVPTPEVYNSTSYAVTIGSADLVPEAGQQMADKHIEIALEIDEEVKKSRVVSK